MTQNPNLYPKPSIAKYFKCNQPGHRSSNCPLRKAFNLVEGIEDWEEGFEDVDIEVFDEIEVTRGDEGERLTRILQRILLEPSAKELEHSQEHELFRTRCTINNECDVIVDGGRSENVVSKALVKAMGLSILKHRRPYKVGWIKKGLGTSVSKVREVTLFIWKQY